MLKGTKPRLLKTKLPHQDFAEKIFSKYRFFRRGFLGGVSLIFRKKVNSKAKYDTPLHHFMLNIRLHFPGQPDEEPSISGAKHFSFIQGPLYAFQRHYLQQIEDSYLINITGPDQIMTRVLRPARTLAFKHLERKAPDGAAHLPGQEKKEIGITDLSAKQVN